MPNNDCRKLYCWQLADRLRTRVIEICAQDTVKREFRFCDGFRDAAGSVCRNLSEGYGRSESCEIVRFFTYALPSLNEVEDYLIECSTKKLIDSAEFDRLWGLAEHARATSRNFMKPHIERCRRRKERQNKKDLEAPP